MIRFRVTALPELFDTMSPSRACPGRPKDRTSTIPPERYRLPPLRTLRNSPGERRDSRSGGETFPTFLAPGLEDGAAGAVVHSMTKTMFPLPSPDLGLICSFHGKTRGWRGGIPRLRNIEKLCQSEAARSSSLPEFGARRNRLVREKNLSGYWHTIGS